MMYDNLTATDMAEANNALRSIASRTLPKSHQIILEVSKARGVPVDDILGNSRVQSIAHARMECYYRIKRDTNLSLPQIGRIFKRDHTSIMSGVKRVEKLGLVV